MASLEKDLREFLLYSGQVGFYEDMMKERRVIQAARLRSARQQAEKKKFWFDVIACTVLVAVGGGIITMMVRLVTSV